MTAPTRFPIWTIRGGRSHLMADCSSMGWTSAFCLGINAAGKNGLAGTDDLGLNEARMLMLRALDLINGMLAGPGIDDQIN